jgi:predicted protein tyrosine phosphatase
MSRPPALVVLGYSEAAMFLRRVPPPRIAGIISIHGRREFGVEAAVAHRLDLTFDDVEVAPPNDLVAVERGMTRKHWAEQNGLTEVAPTADDVSAIARFARTLEGADGILLCHCGGGMSRAPAAALICLATWRGPGTEMECVREVLGLRPGAAPHAGMIRFADELLEREGELVSALAEARW